MARPVPADLEDALAASPAARERFWALPPEQVDDWVGWVERARLPGARRRRVRETVRRLGGRPRAAATTTTVETNGAAPVETNGAAPVRPPRDTWLVWLLALAVLAGVIALVLWLTVYRDTNNAKPGAVVVTAKATVPKLVGIREPAAQFQLKQEKLAGTVVKRPAPKPRGIVVGQKPRAGAVVPQGTVVTLVVSTGPPGAKLPNLTGLAAADAVKRLQALKLTPELKQVASKEAPGTVVGQNPPAGKIPKLGSTVILEVAKGKTAKAVPDVTGQDQQSAVSTLQQAGLNARIVQVPSTQPKGTVVAQRPPAGQKVAQGSDVRLNVSKGPAQQTTTQQTTTQQTTTTTQASAPAPSPQGSGNDYRGMQLQRAVQKIAQGRQQVVVVYVKSTRPAGIVVANRAQGDRELLNVSAGPQPAAATPVPSEGGQDAATAQSRLEAAGFVVLTVDWPVSDQASVGTVVYETPTGRVPRGATIVLYIGSTTG
jgi:beta-lactam-binding protein with PASTA domain